MFLILIYIFQPVEQYQKDGRILRGIQKGAHSFTSSTAMSLLDFTNKLLGVIKFAAGKILFLKKIAINFYL